MCNLKCTTALLIYNEEGNIGPLTERILEIYNEYGIEGEVLLVDDGSTDRSPEICDHLAGKHKNVRVVHHGVNMNRSFAIQTAFREARGDVVIIMDGDYQYEPAEIPLFLQKIDEGYDVVTGYRKSRSDPFMRKLISKVYNWLIIRCIFGLDIRDQNSGFKAFRREKALSMNFDPRGYIGLHRFILPLAAIRGLSIAEIPVSHYDRPSGKSYIKTYTVPFITLRDFFRFLKQYGRRGKK